jgi:hypothetical protein
MSGLSFIHRFELGTQPASRPLLVLHGTGGNESDLAPLGKMIAPVPQFCNVLHIRSAALSLALSASESPWMEAIMSNHAAAAIEIGTVIAVWAGMPIAKQRVPVTQPLNRE